MFNLRDISIRDKLVLMQVFTSVIVLGLCFAAFIASDIKDYKLRKAESMIGLAQVIGTNSISAIRFQDNEAAKEILSDLEQVAPEVLNASIIDTRKNIFAAYTKTGAATFRFSFLPAVNKKFEYTPRQLIVYNSIIDNKETIGTVCLKIELTELDKIIKTQYNIAAVLLVIGVGLAFLIAIVVQRYISTRLLYLVNFMKQVSKTGDYKSHVSTAGKDEITTLSVVFNNLLDQIMENQQKKDEFIGIASHELKTPLTSIKAYLQVLDSIENNQPNKLYVQKSLENVNKLQKLIFELLDVSKIQSGQLQLNLNEVDMDSLIDETVAAFQIISTNHTIIRNGNLLHKPILADRQRIEQVLINLLSNATKYSPDAKEVIVSTEKSNSAFIIKVKDFGIGIAREEQGKIFDRFYRTKKMSVLISGFGLGLYICKDIIQRHNGKIWMESEKTGSAFYVSLPIDSAANN